MEKFKTVLKVIYFTLLSISILLGMVWGVLLEIPFPKPEWFDALDDIIALSAIITMTPLLIYGLAYSVREKRKIFKIYVIVLSVFITFHSILLMTQISFFNLQVLEIPYAISFFCLVLSIIPAIVYAIIRHRRK